MARIHKSIEIKAPINKVFSYIDDPMNEPDWLPSMIKVKSVTGSGIGTHYEWSWKIGKIIFDGNSTRIENVPEQRIVVNSKGKHGVESKWIYHLKKKGNVTVFVLEIEYKIPNRVLGKPVEKMIMERNNRETDLGLMNIKKILEEQV